MSGLCFYIISCVPLVYISISFIDLTTLYLVFYLLLNSTLFASWFIYVNHCYVNTFSCYFFITIVFYLLRFQFSKVKIKNIKKYKKSGQKHSKTRRGKNQVKNKPQKQAQIQVVQKTVFTKSLSCKDSIKNKKNRGNFFLDSLCFLYILTIYIDFIYQKQLTTLSSCVISNNSLSISLNSSNIRQIFSCFLCRYPDILL